MRVTSVLAAVLVLAGGVVRAGAPSAAERRVEVSRRTSPAPDPARERVRGRDVAFLENGGRTDARVTHTLFARNANVFVTKTGLTYSLRGTGPADAKRWTVRAEFEGATATDPVAGDQRPGITSFFRGPKSSWRAGLRSYGSLEWTRAWPGIDVRVAAGNQRIKTEYHVAAGARPSDIRIAWTGADVSVAKDGSLAISTPIAAFSDAAPIAWQDGPDGREPVEVAWRVERTKAGATASFALGAYDASRPLVIDPCTYAYSGFLGGSGDDYAHAIATDAQQNTYVAGQTTSVDGSFPVSVGPDLTHNTGGVRLDDAWVAKLDPLGTTLWCGFIGGADDDVAYGVAADAAGNVYVCGTTFSDESSFPVNGGPAQAVLDDGPNDTDAFVAKVNPAGTALTWCGFVGGNGGDDLYGIRVDGSGDVYVAGKTASTDFPVAGGLASTSYAAGFGTNAVVARISASGSSYVFSGYVTGTDPEGPDGEFNAITLDATGHVYCVGRTAATESHGFPVTGGPDLTYNGGNYDGIVAKFSPAGILQRLGYIGGSEDDRAWSVAVDSSNRVWVGGETLSSEATFPVAQGPDLTFGGLQDGFVSRVRADFSGLDISGFVGSSAFDSVRAVVMGTNGDVRFAGWTGGSIPLVGATALARAGDVDEAIFGTVASSNGAFTEMSYVHLEASPSAAECAAVSTDGSLFVGGYCGASNAPTEVFPSDGQIDHTTNGALDTLLLRVPGIPDAPTITSVTANGVTSIDVVFQDGSTAELGFLIERTSPDGGADASYPLPLHAGTGPVTYQDTAIFPDTTYTYRVKAVGVCVDSAFSGSLSAQTTTTMDFVITKGQLTDSVKAAKDAFKAKGTFSYRAESPDDTFDRTTDDVRLRFGGAGARIAVDIPAGSTGWKANKKGVLTWKSARGVKPVVKFVMDPAKLTYSLTVSKATYPGAQANPIGLIYKARNDGGRRISDWRALPRGKFKTP